MPGRSPVRVRSPRQQGSVLILVVWAVVLLSLLAAGLGSHSVFALDLTTRLERQLQSSYIAVGSVPYVVHVLAEDTTQTFDGLGDDWVNSEFLFSKQRLGDGAFTISRTTADHQTVYGLLDEDRKLNLNTMPGGAFDVLLQEVGGMREEQAKVVADSIEDWRDEDGDTRPYGAENFYYHGRSGSYDCKNGPFENVEELLLVRGMTPEVYVRVAPYLTVYGSGAVNLNTADRAVLSALGLSPEGVQGIITYRAADDGLDGTHDDRALTSITAAGAVLGGQYLPAEDVNRVIQLAQHDLLTVKSEEFRASIDAQADDARHPVRVSCVVNRKGEIKSWAEQ